MTREDDFIRQLEGYLDDYEGLTPLPDATRDAIRAQLPKTRQIGSLTGPMRYLSMSMSIPAPARYGLAAAVVAAAVLGAAVFSRNGGIGADGTPTPVPTATSVPTPTPEPTPELLEPGAIAPAADVDSSYRLLQAGTYHVDLGMRVSFTVPAGWGEFAYTSEKSQINLNNDSGDGELSFEIVENVSAGSCTDELLDPPVGPSVDDLVTALSAMEGFDVSPVTDVTIDGYRGKQFTMTAPTSSGCDILTWATSTRQNGVGLGEVNHVRILDVDGARLLIGLAHPSDPGIQREVDGILDSIQIRP
jgi:hypothetical protein